MRYIAAAAAIALIAGACGATPPQAPLPAAKKLDEATSGISTACGEQYQLTAFPGAPPEQLRSIKDAASSSSAKLALVYARKPGWIYQGSTVRQIVAQSVSMLDSCGLRGVATWLLRATARH